MHKLPDRILDTAILHMAARKFPQGYSVSPDAPDTLEKLSALLDAGNRMVVFDGGCERTIYSSPEVNHAFRAWHDWHHWRHHLAFDAAGEARACMYQQQDLRDVYGDNHMTRQWCAILDAEINGQLAYAEKHGGNFPVDQLAFVREYLTNPNAAILATF